MSRFISSSSVFLACLVALPACLGPVCTMEAVAGLNVVVTDAATGERICDAVVTAKDGDFEETLSAVGEGAECGYAGAFEREGTYEVTATKDGFAAATQADVVVGADVCHVIGEDVALELAQQEG